MPSGKRHYRLTVADALAAHNLALRYGGGREGILSIPSIESAIARPFSGYYRPIQKKAAALVESCARNHGFIDGNKRTCLLLLGLLLDRSGYVLLRADGQRESDAAVEAMILDVAERRMNLAAIEEWMRQRIRRAD